MCTAVTYKTGDFYFGRTLDYEFSYGEEVTVMPRHYPLKLRHLGTLERHYAVIGMAHVAEGYPLYYDAVNEKGLAMAGLNFVGNAHYNEPVAGKRNELSLARKAIDKRFELLLAKREGGCHHYHARMLTYLGRGLYRRRDADDYKLGIFLA